MKKVLDVIEATKPLAKEMKTCEPGSDRDHELDIKICDIITGVLMDDPEAEKYCIANASDGEIYEAEDRHDLAFNYLWRVIVNPE